MEATLTRTAQILIIEDSKTDVMLFKHLLGPLEKKCAITDVPRMIDGFRQIDERHFDLIVLDLNLIDLDGIHNITAIKAQCPETPVIVYSGRCDPRLQKQAYEIGAESYIVKGETSSVVLQNTVTQALAY